LVFWTAEELGKFLGIFCHMFRYARNLSRPFVSACISPASPVRPAVAGWLVRQPSGVEKAAIQAALDGEKGTSQAAPDRAEFAALGRAQLLPWGAFGLVFNSTLIIGTDWFDVFIAADLGLSPVASSAMASGFLATGGVGILCMLPGAMDMPQEPAAWRAKLTGRIMGLMFGLSLGMFPLSLPDEWRLWERGAATIPQQKRIHLNEEELATQEKAMQRFPNSFAGKPLEAKVYEQLAKRGWNAKNTLLAHSSCPDEVNYDADTDFVNVLHNRFGKRFTLGGLAGMAFAGKTGWSAFSHHTPDDNGNILILYGPHVGVSSDGKAGYVNREGQLHASTCCGAAIAAFNAKSVPTGDEWMHDMQQIALTKLLAPYREKIAQADDPMVELAYANFEVSHEFIRNQVTSPQKVCKEIAIIGGIMLNLPGHIPDRFIPLTFELLECSTGHTHDLFSHLECDRRMMDIAPFFQDQSILITEPASSQ